MASSKKAGSKKADTKKADTKKTVRELRSRISHLERRMDRQRRRRRMLEERVSDLEAGLGAAPGRSPKTRPARTESVRIGAPEPAVAARPRDEASMAELRAMARARGMVGTSRLRKAELRERLSGEA